MMRYYRVLLIALCLCLVGIQTGFPRDLPRRVYDTNGKDINLYKLETQKEPTKKLSKKAFSKIANYGLSISKRSNDKKRYLVNIDGKDWWIKTIQARTDKLSKIRPCISSKSSAARSATRGAGECSK